MKTPSWANRIIGYGEEAPDQLLANPKNWRLHPQTQQYPLHASLESLGWIQDVIVNLRTSELWPPADRNVQTIVDGHLRITLALRHDQPSVPVKYVDLSPDEENIALATLDPLATLAIADKEKLDKLLREMPDAMDLRLQAMLGELAEKEGLLLDGDAGGEVIEGPEPQINRAEELREKWGTELGQIWEIPSKTAGGMLHRLMCGDSTKPENILLLMGGSKAILTVTDPPYGVEYDAEWRNELLNRKAVSRGKVKNDDRADWGDVFKLISSQVVYCWHGGKATNLVQQGLEKAGYDIVCQIIWAKPHFAIGRGDFHWQHESCWYAVKKGYNHNWQGSRTESTLWEIGIGCQEKTGHGTEKPLECMGRPIRLNTSLEQLVCDPFIGSGTTMVAAEKLGRLCYGMEIAPEYVAVCLERMADMGLEPHRV